MLAIGTDYEYYNAVWVKNEWSQYLKLMAKGQLQSTKLATLESAYKSFRSISGWLDADKLMEVCLEEIDRIKRKESYKEYLIKKENELLDQLSRIDREGLFFCRKAQGRGAGTDLSDQRRIKKSRKR